MQNTGFGYHIPCLAAKPCFPVPRVLLFAWSKECYLAALTLLGWTQDRLSASITKVGRKESPCNKKLSALIKVLLALPVRQLQQDVDSGRS